MPVLASASSCRDAEGRSMSGENFSRHNAFRAEPHRPVTQKVNIGDEPVVNTIAEKPVTNACTAPFDFNRKIQLNVISIIGQKRTRATAAAQLYGKWCSIAAGEKEWTLKKIQPGALPGSCGGVEFFEGDSLREYVQDVFFDASRLRQQYGFSDSLLFFDLYENGARVREMWHVAKFTAGELLLGKKEKYELVRAGGIWMRKKT